MIDMIGILYYANKIVVS